MFGGGGGGGGGQNKARSGNLLHTFFLYQAL